MTALPFTAVNIGEFANDSPAYIVGKNGFGTELGTIPVLVTSCDKSDGDDTVTFTIRGLSKLYDKNTESHIFNNNVFAGEKQVSYRLFQNESDTSEGDVAYLDPYVYVTSNIVEFDLTANTIKINNVITEEIDLYSKLESTPFYVKLYQPLRTNAFSDKSIYVSGTTLNKVKIYNVFSNVGVYTANIGLVPEDKRFISVYLDGQQINKSDFTWDGGTSVDVTLDNSYSEMRVFYSLYTVPTIEKGDNISVIFNNVYTVANASYLPETTRYNAFLTTDKLYKVYLFDNLLINATSFVGTNISPNPFGVIGNVDIAANTFTLDYDALAYPGLFTLANNYVYRLVLGNKYTSLNLTEGRTLYGVDPGTISVRAQNINPAGRKSSISTATLTLGDLILPAITNLTITENIYLDTTQGVSTRALISFDHIPNKEILGYEISYKIEGETAGLGAFSTVQIPVNAVDPNTGRMNYTINSIDRGRTAGVNYLVLRITPINNNLTGITKQVVHTIIGKTAPPLNVSSFTAAQNGNILTLFWAFVSNFDGTIFDLDLQEVDIRRVLGTVTSAEDMLAAWATASRVGKVAIPSNNHNFLINSFGTYTYLIKTRDTSKNESVNVMGVVITLVRPPNLEAYQTWSEDNPAANSVISFLTNNNYYEYNWPSFANSDNGGFNYAVDDPVTVGVGPSTLVENANGTSSGFSISGGDPTVLLFSSNSYYQTQVRDLGEILSGKVTIGLNVYSILASTWLSMRENLTSGVSDSSPSQSIMWDDGSFLGTILQANNAVYDNLNGTLISPDSYGNVYAIWNSGQFDGDISNANSFALIAGVINAHAVRFGATFLAGGVSSGSNNLPNLATSAGSYQLVNLKQWADPDGLGNWLGPVGLITDNIEIRHSLANPYFQTGNANVNVAQFNSGAAPGEWTLYQGGEINARWFQLKLNMFNANPSLASGILDQFNYTLDLTNKVYTTTVNVVSNPTIVTYAAMQFKTTPRITLQPLIESNLRVNNTFASYNPEGSNSTHANIAVYTNTGAFVSGVRVNMHAIGY